MHNGMSEVSAKDGIAPEEGESVKSVGEPPLMKLGVDMSELSDYLDNMI